MPPAAKPFTEQMVADAEATGKMLSKILADSNTPASRLRDAMVYAVMNGGKRMRAALVLGAARLSCGEGDTNPRGDQGPLRVAAALEMLHAYSLVHDDLPAMDDSAMRRGQPSCHIAFDEATAILAGDALQTMAFATLADSATHPDPAIQARLVSCLARASGVSGMAGGQMLDLEAEARPFDLDEIKQMQSLKTGALIQCAAICGGLIGGADDRLLTALEVFSRDLGLAFQIADDLLDHAGDAAVLGKPTGQDAHRGKASLVDLMGVPAAQDAANGLIDTAVAALQPWPATGYLIDLARFAIARTS